MEGKNPVEEAQRYVDNAKKLLIENGEFDVETRLYGDRRTRVHIEDYLEAVNQRDGKLAKLVSAAYQTMHLYMGYDGVLDKNTCDSGFRLANDIIDRCAKFI